MRFVHASPVAAVVASLVALAGAGWAGEVPGITLPAAVRGEPGEFVVVVAKTPGKMVRWVVPTGLNQLDPELLKDAKTAVFTTAKPGVYRVQAYSAVGDIPTELAETVITIGQSKPPPDPPAPADPLTKALQAAYDADGAVDKRERLRALEQVMRLGIGHAKAAPTTAELSRLVTLDRIAAVQDALPGVRKVIGDHLNPLIPKENAAITPEMRAKLVAGYQQVVVALEGVR